MRGSGSAVPEPLGEPGPGELDVLLSLMDRQIVDDEGSPVGKVDDLELAEDADGRLVLAALLSGPGALNPRLGDPVGRWGQAIWRRFSTEGGEGLVRIGVDRVCALDSAVHLAGSDEALTDRGLERWMREHVIERLPGGAR